MLTLLTLTVPVRVTLTLPTLPTLPTLILDIGYRTLGLLNSRIIDTLPVHVLAIT